MNRIPEKVGGPEVQADSRQEPAAPQGRDLNAEKQRFSDLVRSKRGSAEQNSQLPKDSADSVADDDSPLQHFPTFSSAESKPKAKVAQQEKGEDGQSLRQDDHVSESEPPSDVSPHSGKPPAITDNGDSNQSPDQSVQKGTQPDTDRADAQQGIRQQGVEKGAQLGMERADVQQIAPENVDRAGVQAKAQKNMDKDAFAKPSQEVTEQTANQKNYEPAETIAQQPRLRSIDKDSIPVRADPLSTTLPFASLEDPEELLPQATRKASKSTQHRSVTTKTERTSASSGRKLSDSDKQQGKVMPGVNSDTVQSSSQQTHQTGTQQPVPSSVAQPSKQDAADDTTDKAKDKTQQIDNQSSEASGDRILQGLMSPGPIQPTVENTAPATSNKIGDLADKLAQRILVSDPANSTHSEVRIQLHDSVLQGTEVTVRQEQGQLVVGFSVPNNDVNQQLLPHTDNLQQMLGDKLNQPVRVEVNVQSGGADSGGAGGGGQRGSGDQNDGHSRNRRDWDEWDNGS
ncbi:MAG: type III secretion HpaP family protein [Candidatus Competibacteraceae bacterium]|jgi:type III secretion system needle length determinant|nr:type III secretion HpaP family protein [Candidatus Competibacteraceae bacterium]